MARIALSGPPVWASAARQAYLDGTSLAKLQATYKASPSTLYIWIDRVVAADGSITLQPVPRRRIAAPGPSAAQQTLRVALVRRLWRAADAQMRQLERRIAALDPEAPPGDAEAKALGLIARIVRELMTLDAASAASHKPSGGEKDDERPFSAADRERETARIAQLRAEIARRLAGDDDGAEAVDAGRDDSGYDRGFQL